MKALWIAVIIGAVAGSIDFWHIVIISATGGQISAPQQAAGAAMALASAVIPYVLVRAIEKCAGREIEELRRVNMNLTEIRERTNAADRVPALSKGTGEKP